MTRTDWQDDAQWLLDERQRQREIASDEGKEIDLDYSQPAACDDPVRDARVAA